MGLTHKRQSGKEVLIVATVSLHPCPVLGVICTDFALPPLLRFSELWRQQPNAGIHAARPRGSDDAISAERGMGRVRVIDRWKGRASQLRTETYAMYFACKDPRAPWYAKLVTLLVAGYAFSPIDPIPDFIPLVGFLDELVILPLGIALALRLMPASVLAEARRRARAAESQPVSRVAAFFVITALLLLAALGITVAA